MAIGNVELVHKGFPKHVCMGTARMKIRHRNSRRRWDEKSVYGTKPSKQEKKVPNGQTIAWVYCTPGVTIPKAVDELPTELNTHKLKTT